MARARGLVSTAATAAVVAVAAAAAIAATATTAAAASCAPRTVDGSVVVEAEAGGGSGGGWEPVTASGARGIMWKSWKAARSVDGPGQGVRSYTVEVMEGGYYRLLLRASGASVRDHNEYVWWEAARLSRGVEVALGGGAMGEALCCSWQTWRPAELAVAGRATKRQSSDSPVARRDDGRDEALTLLFLACMGLFFSLR